MLRIKNKLKREIIEWVFIIGVPLGLYLSGWHTEVIGQMQRVILLTNIIKPEVPDPNRSGLETADLQLLLTSSNGEPVNLQDFKGKTLFVNFWATWCPPCIAEMPEIESLFNKMDPKTVAFFLITVDQDWNKALDFVARKGFSFPVYRLNSPIPASFRSEGIPATFVVAPDGSIVTKRVGMASYDNPEFRQFLNSLGSASKNL